MAAGFPVIFGGAPKNRWTPAQISSALWLDAADANTVTLNGSTVSQWSDKSGNGRNATQPTAASQPGYAKAQNFIRSSEQIGGFGWGLIDATVSADQIVAPDGTLTADKVQETASNVFHMARQIFPCAASTQYTMSAYFKKAERDIVFLNPFLAGVGGVSVWANLTTGTVASTSASVWTINSTAVTAVGNDWYRVSITFTTTAVAGDVIADFGLSTAANVSQYQGVVGNGAYLWGAQVQQGVLSVYQKTDATNQPLLAGINGIPTTNWSGDFNIFLDTDAWSLAPNRKYASVVVAASSTWGGGNRFGRIWVSRSGYTQGYLGQGGVAGSVLAIAGTLATTTVITGVSGANVVSHSFSTSGLADDEFDLAVNGGTPVSLTGNTGPLGTSGIRIGADLVTVPGSNNWDGQIGEIVIVSGDLTVANRQKLEGYLAWKWGLEANLPSNHPYKLLPPTV